MLLSSAWLSGPFLSLLPTGLAVCISYFYITMIESPERSSLQEKVALTLSSGAVVHHGRESPGGGSSLATVVETCSTACSHLSTSGDRDLGYGAGTKRLKSTSWALCIKDLITSPSSTTGWEPSVQTHECSNTRAWGRHFRFKPQH